MKKYYSLVLLFIGVALGMEENHTLLHDTMVSEVDSVALEIEALKNYTGTLELPIVEALDAVVHSANADAMIKALNDAFIVCYDEDVFKDTLCKEDSIVHMILSSGYNPDQQAKALKAVHAWNRDLNAQNENGDTALHIAARARSNCVIECLCALKVDVNRRNNDGRTPLLELLMHDRTATGSNYDRVKYFLQAGASTSIPDNNSDTVDELVNIVHRNRTNQGNFVVRWVSTVISWFFSASQPSNDDANDTDKYDVVQLLLDHRKNPVTLNS